MLRHPNESPKKRSYIIRKLHIFGVNAENLKSPNFIWNANIYLPVKSTKPPECRVYVVGRLVAPITITCARDLRPSIKVKSCETIRLSTSPFVFSRLGAIESISSINMMDGAFFSASSKAFLRLLLLGV